MRGERILHRDGHAGPAVERAIFAGRFTQRDEEVVDAHDHAGHRRLLPNPDRYFNLLAAPRSQRGKQKSLLQIGRVRNARGDAGKVAGGRVARAAAAGAIEVGASGLRIAGQHVSGAARVAIAGDRFDALMQEVRQLDDLGAVSVA